MDELQVVLAQRAVFVAGGVLCVLLAVQLIGKHRAIAERLERATTDLKWVIADARRASSRPGVLSSLLVPGSWRSRLATIDGSGYGAGGS